MSNFKRCGRCKRLKDLKGLVNCKSCITELTELQKRTTPICKGNMKTGESCNNHSLENSEYCGLHDDVAKEIAKANANNTKICASYGHNKNCEKQLPINSSFKICQSCRDGEKTRVNKNRNSIVDKNNLIINNVNIINKDIECLKCGIQFRYGTSVSSKGKFSMKCPSCFAKQQQNDLKRARNK
jgi:hypothetical protein